MPILTAVRADITEQRVDAIVNAANTRMRGGGGVDGAIHRAAGRGLLKECEQRFPDGLGTGNAGWTNGHHLPARWVIHVVGPVYDGSGGDRGLLVSCYVNALRIADLGVGADGGQLLEQVGVRALGRESGGELGRAAHLHVPVGGAGRDVLEVPVPGAPEATLLVRAYPLRVGLGVPFRPRRWMAIVPTAGLSLDLLSFRAQGLTDAQHGVRLEPAAEAG